MDTHLKKEHLYESIQIHKPFARNRPLERDPIWALNDENKVVPMVIHLSPLTKVLKPNSEVRQQTHANEILLVYG